MGSKVGGHRNREAAGTLRVNKITGCDIEIDSRPDRGEEECGETGE